LKQPADQRRLAVIDLGSTSFHLLVADLSVEGGLERVDRETEQLRLGAVIENPEGIPAEVFDRALATAAGLRATAEALGAEEILPVGTAALREAANGGELCLQLAEVLGQPVRLLSGEEEARVIFAAFQRRLPLPGGPTLGADLGGGSLELAIGDEDGIGFECTLRLGAARLHRELVATDPMSRREIHDVCERVRETLAPHRTDLLRMPPRIAVATGGSARALGHLDLGLHGRPPVASVNGLELRQGELRQLTEILVHTTHDERLGLAGIRERKADLMPTAALILLVLTEELGLDGFTLCDWGLREGILLDAFGDPSHFG
jgi:exopolyphosphatase/guanosine-5'-triphosphate,3'-diphosphate pyrophosphatase